MGSYSYINKQVNSSTSSAASAKKPLTFFQSFMRSFAILDRMC